MCGLRRLRLGGAAALLLAVLALVVGCSSEPPMAQVSGKVTFKGQPVPAGWISFIPESGKGSARVCQIKDGMYDSATEKQPGVYPGKNLIKIAGFDGKKIPLWGQGKQIFNPVDLTFEIPAGSTTKDFEIPDSAGQNLKIVPTADE